MHFVVQEVQDALHQKNTALHLIDLHIYILSMTYSTNIDSETGVKGVMVLLWCQYVYQQMTIMSIFAENHTSCEKKRWHADAHQFLPLLNTHLTTHTLAHSHALLIPFTSTL